MKRACDDPVHWFLDLEVMVGDNDEGGEEDEEDNDSTSPGVPDYSVPAYSCIY